MYDAWLDEQIDYSDPDEPNNDEWTDDAENEPEVDEDGLEVEYEDEDDIPGSEWARALMEEEDAEIERERRENAPLIKPEGKCATLRDHNGVFWKL